MAHNSDENNTFDVNLEKKYRPLVIALSIVIPVIVAALFGLKIEGYNTQFLPPIYATINGITAIVLALAVISIKNGNKKRHESLMKIAIGCSLLFLVGYILYHITSDSTYFGDSDHNGELSAIEKANLGSSALVYYMLLISHIILSIAIIPLVMITYLKAWAGNFKSHKKLAKITFPIWLYVAVSGVVVYLMISPYYG